MDEWIDNEGPAEGADSLVREEKDIHIGERVQSQTQAGPTAGAPGVRQEI